ncbi:MAG: mechanosensitive ion channel family protein [Gemmataceae bacterium]|nr:mechanosensitive ion channel family protein [Gemmataceae bacterium]
MLFAPASPRRLLLAVAAATAFLAPSLFAADPDGVRARAYLDRSLAQKLGSPRQTMETLCFAMDAYDVHKELIEEAVSCLDIDAKDGYSQETRALLASELYKILDDLSFPFESIPGGADGDPVTFYEDKDLRIVLTRGSDNLWRFDKTTVRNIMKMRQAISARVRQRNQARAQLREGLEDPTATMTVFLKHAAAGDYESSASALDLSSLKREDRPTLGPILAWKLACIIQRRGYVFGPSVPVEPDGPPYTWSLDTGGRIVVERVRQPGGRDTWLFSTSTVQSIDALWERDKVRLVDPRYLVLKSVVPAPPDNLKSDTAVPSTAPASVPPDFSSPRRMVRAFFRLMDEAEYEDGKLTEASGFIDLAHVPLGDVNSTGPKLATMLEAVFRKLRPDLSQLSDKWSAPTQIMTGPGNLRIEVVRQSDGCWRFSGDTAARLPGMYESISGQDKASNERTQGLGTPRETLVTFFRTVNTGDMLRASHCLDLTDLPISARDNLGPILAFKLKSVLDRTGRIYLQEIPNDPDGARLTLYRGPLGRIVLAKRDDDATKAWRFTAGTVRHIETMFERAIDTPINPTLVGASHIRVEPDLWKEPGIWVRVHMPPALRRPALGLQVYQWLGLVLVLVLSAFVGWLATRAMQPILGRLFPRVDGLPGPDLGCRGIGSLGLLVFLLTLYYLSEWVDLPSALAAQFFSVEKLVNTVALVWAGWQMTDLIRLYRERKKEGKTERGLGDLVVPFMTRIVKLVIFLVGTTYLVYEFGQGDSLKQFLAGLGIAGLAVSLAAQDSLKNLFATMLLIGDRSFRVGDRLIIGDKEGVVEQLGFRSTKLRTNEDSLITLPNSVLAQGVIDNLGLRKLRRVRTTFVVPSDTPLDRVSELCTGLREYVSARPGGDPKRAEVTVTGIREGGVGLEVVAFCDAQDADAEKRCREEVTYEIVRRARSLEVKLSTTKT